MDGLCFVVLKQLHCPDRNLNFFYLINWYPNEKRLSSYSAVAGGFGNGAPENGDYTVDTYRDRSPSGSFNRGMNRDNVGFSFNLNPEFTTGRTDLRIHPDGNNEGTLGCIGLGGNANDLTSFRDKLNGYLQRQSSVPLNINIIEIQTTMAEMEPIQMASMNKWLLICIAMSLLNCGFNSEHVQQNIFKADSTINNALKLENVSSLRSIKEDVNKLISVEDLRESPVVVFLNADRSEYLLAYHYEGDTKNAFACFEFGYTSALKLPKQFSVLNIDHFCTESGLRLGMDKSRVVKIKGQPSKVSKDGTFSYHLDAKSTFVRSYKMPEYFMECSTKALKINRIKFGFDYP